MKGIVQPDLIVRDALVSFFTALSVDSSLIDRVFPTRPDTERQDMRAYFEDHQPPIKLGYPRGETELPGIFVTLGTLAESYQTIGEVIEEEKIDDIHTEWHGSHFAGIVKAACWTNNADITCWYQALVYVSVLQSRGDLNSLGLQEQKLGATDFEPLPQFFPDSAFRRDVTLTFTAQMSAPIDFPSVEQIEVEATGTDPSAPPTTVVVRN